MNEKEKLREQIRKELNTILDEEYEVMLQEMKNNQTFSNSEDNDVDSNDSQASIKD